MCICIIHAYTFVYYIYNISYSPILECQNLLCILMSCSKVRIQGVINGITCLCPVNEGERRAKPTSFILFAYLEFRKD